VQDGPVQDGPAPAGRRASLGQRLERARPGVLLTLTVATLAAGGAAHLAGASGAGDHVWSTGAALAALSVAWSTALVLWRGHLGVDAIALLALVGAVAVGEPLAAAVIAVMVGSGGTLEAWAAGRARRDLAAVLARRPTVVHRRRGGVVETVPPEAVEPGDLLVVGPGEVVAIDGMVVATPAVLDESALTGEGLPVERPAGDAVRSGVVNVGGPFELRATATAANSTYDGIVRLVAAAETTRPPFVRLADRYAQWFLGLTLAVAGAGWAAGGAARAVAVLVVATPCPLILAAPIAFVAGLSRAARREVVVKGGDVLERLARCRTLLVDKTGTLTLGQPRLASVVSAGERAESEILALAASLDQLSSHVLAAAVVRAATERDLALSLPVGVDEVAGRGVRGSVNGHLVAVGKAEWTGVQGVPPWAKAARRAAALDGALTVFVSVDGRPAGVLVFQDPLRPDGPSTIWRLRKNGFDRIVMVTGDRREVAETVAAAIGVDGVVAEVSPAEKLAVIELERRRGPTVMVGDGVNDAPALAVADVGVALGARGATASSEAADVVVTVDRLDRVGEAVTLARRTRAIAWESVVIGMALSVAGMGVAAFGLLPAVWGALAQEAIDVAVIVNALRALSVGPGRLRLGGDEERLVARFLSEHRAIRADLEEVRAAADAIGSPDRAAALAAVRRVQRLLVEEVEPHEAAEEEAFYGPAHRALGAVDPTGALSRAHLEIAHQIRRLGRVLDGVGAEGLDDVDVVDLRQILYGLYAILALHTATEEESYRSMEDVAGG
jgi:heavy metal translocating P-type ATPase